MLRKRSENRTHPVGQSSVILDKIRTKMTRKRRKSQAEQLMHWVQGETGDYRAAKCILIQTAGIIEYVFSSEHNTQCAWKNGATQQSQVREERCWRRQVQKGEDPGAGGDADLLSVRWGAWEVASWAAQQWGVWVLRLGLGHGGQWLGLKRL